MITQWILRNQKSPILQIKLSEDKQDFKIVLNKTLLNNEGRLLIKDLLHVMQVYKSSGNIERAAKFYNDYSQVPE